MQIEPALEGGTPFELEGGSIPPKLWCLEPQREGPAYQHSPVTADHGRSRERDGAEHSLCG